MMLYVTGGMEITKKMWVCHCHWHQRNKSVKQIEGFKSNKYCCQQPKCVLRMDLDVHTALMALLVEHTGGYENGIWRGIIKWQHGMDHRSNKSNVNMKIGEGHTCWGSNAFCLPVAHFKSGTFRSPKEAHLIFMADIFGHIYGSNLQTGSFGKAIDLMRCAACSTEPTSYPRKGKKNKNTNKTNWSASRWWHIYFPFNRILGKWECVCFMSVPAVWSRWWERMVCVAVWKCDNYSWRWNHLKLSLIRRW